MLPVSPNDFELKYAKRSVINLMLKALKTKSYKCLEGWMILELRPKIKDGKVLQQAIDTIYAYRCGELDLWDAGTEIAWCLGFHVIREDTL